MDGTSLVNFSNWQQGEPDAIHDGAQNCVEQDMVSGKWSDTHCGEFKGFACEFPKGEINPVEQNMYVYSNEADIYYYVGMHIPSVLTLLSMRTSNIPGNTAGLLFSVTYCCVQLDNELKLHLNWLSIKILLII